MRDRVTIRSFTESNRAVVSRQSNRIFLFWVVSFRRCRPSSSHFPDACNRCQLLSTIVGNCATNPHAHRTGDRERSMTAGFHQPLPELIGGVDSIILAKV
jgi:hypothetical protein